MSKFSTIFARSDWRSRVFVSAAVAISVCGVMSTASVAVAQEIDPSAAQNERGDVGSLYKESDAEGQGATTPISADEAVRLALSQSPELERALIEEERARLLVEREDAERTPLLTADAGYRYGQFPDLSAQGTRLIDSSALSLAGRLAHTLPIGTRVALSASLNRGVRDSIVLGDLGVAYDASIAAEITQPLLRGAGRDVVDAALIAARQAERLRLAQNNELASQILIQVLSTYWDLWLAEQSLEIQQGAGELARQNMENIEVRLEAGAVAPADLIPLRIEIAQVEERLLTARARVRERSVELARLLGMPPEQQLRARADAPAAPNFPELDAVMER